MARRDKIIVGLLIAIICGPAIVSFVRYGSPIPPLDADSYKSRFLGAVYVTNGMPYAMKDVYASYMDTSQGQSKWPDGAPNAYEIAPGMTKCLDGPPLARDIVLVQWTNGGGQRFSTTVPFRELLVDEHEDWIPERMRAELRITLRENAEGEVRLQTTLAGSAIPAPVREPDP